MFYKTIDIFLSRKIILIFLPLKKYSIAYSNFNNALVINIIKGQPQINKIIIHVFLRVNL